MRGERERELCKFYVSGNPSLQIDLQVSDLLHRERRDQAKRSWLMASKDGAGMEEDLHDEIDDPMILATTQSQDDAPWDQEEEEELSLIHISEPTRPY